MGAPSEGDGKEDSGTLAFERGVLNVKRGPLGGTSGPLPCLETTGGSIGLSWNGGGGLDRTPEGTEMSDGGVTDNPGELMAWN